VGIKSSLVWNSTVNGAKDAQIAQADREQDAEGRTIYRAQSIS
jgi:hypothetical protein